MTDSSASSAAAAAASSVGGGWQTLRCETSNNHALQQLRVRPDMRVRVEVINAASSTTDPSSSSSYAKATLRYIGPVAAAKDPTATMLGIEWDEASRGRNDGSVGGKRYFHCTLHDEVGPKSGSFIHAARVRSGWPRSLDSAIFDKYESHSIKEGGEGLYLVAEHNKPIQGGSSSSSSSNTDPTSDSSQHQQQPLRHIPVVFQGAEYMARKIQSSVMGLKDVTLTQGDIYRAFEDDPEILKKSRDASSSSSSGSTVGEESKDGAGHENEEEADEEEDRRYVSASARLSSKIPNVTSLDLTDNLFVDWKEVAWIARSLPKLKLLATSRNFMQIDSLFSVVQHKSSSSAASVAAAPPSPLSSRPLRPLFTTCFQHVETLVLNSVPHAWESVLILARHSALSSLSELHLAKNSIKRLRKSARDILFNQPRQDPNPNEEDPDLRLRQRLATIFPKLKVLELSHNEIMEWDEIRCLELLPCLDTLLLNSNELKEIRYDGVAMSPSTSTATSTTSAVSLPSSSSSLQPFASLTSLGLNSNKLVSFASIDALARFPKLRELRIQHNAGLAEETMRMDAAGNVKDDGGGGGVGTTNGIVGHSASLQQSPSSPNVSLSAPSPPAPSDSVQPSPPSSSSSSSRLSSSLFRLQLIARLPNLVSLNRSMIKWRERMDAEKYYVLTAFQNCLAEVNKDKGNANTSTTTTGPAAAASTRLIPSLDFIQARFNRYQHLVSKHGDPAATVDALAKQAAEASGSTLASNLIELNWIILEPVPAKSGASATASSASSSSSSSTSASNLPLPASAIPSTHKLKSHQSKKVAPTLTVQTIRTMLEKTFKIAAYAKNKYSFYYVAPPQPPPTNDGSETTTMNKQQQQWEVSTSVQKLDESSRPLTYYDVAQGGSLVLIKKA